MIIKDCHVDKLESLKNSIDELEDHCNARYTTPMKGTTNTGGIHIITEVVNGGNDHGLTVIENQEGMRRLINKYRNKILGKFQKQMSRYASLHISDISRKPYS